MSRRRRTPRQFANGTAAAQLDAYLMAGQPMEDCGCGDDACPRCVACVKAIEALSQRLAEKAGQL